MILRSPPPWLIAFLATTALAMVIAAGTGEPALSEAAAAIFGTGIVAVAVARIVPFWRKSRPAFVSDDSRRVAFSRLAELVMLAYFWCGGTMLAIYLLTPVTWRHGWQYGTAMLLIAAAHVHYLRRFSASSPLPAHERSYGVGVALATAQAIAVILALAWLVASGKLQTAKGDWAANQIFLAGGIAVAFVSSVIVATHVALSRRGK